MSDEEQIKDFRIERDRIYGIQIFYKAGKYERVFFLSIDEAKDILRTKGIVIKGYYTFMRCCIQCTIKENEDIIKAIIYDETNKILDIGTINKEELKKKINKK